MIIKEPVYLKSSSKFVSSLAISLLLAQLALANNLQKPVQDEQQSKFLQGGIEHSVKLPPVDKAYRRGKTIDLSKSGGIQETDQAPANRWYQLPDWAAGKWISTRSTRTYAKNLRSNYEELSPKSREVKMDFSWGFQQDASGHVWEYAKEPYTLVLESREHKLVKRILKRTFVSCTESSLLLKVLSENLIVNPLNNQIIKTVQVENIETCKPTANECMSCLASYKVFDERGQPLELGKETNIARRLAPFRSVDEYEGKNMKVLFNEFLSSEGMIELIRQNSETLSK